MKKLFISFLLLFYGVLFSQNYKEFFVVEKPNHSLSPTQISTLSNGRLSIEFSDQSLQNFFTGKSIFNYKKYFANSNIGRLNRIYFIKTNSNVSAEDFLTLPNVEDAYEFEDYETFYTPNDYYYNYFDWNVGMIEGDYPNSSLELIKARHAWDLLSQSSNTITIGIADNAFNPIHEDLSENILSYEGGTNTNDPNAHGALVTGFVVADTDNNIGIASIAGANTKVRFKSGGLSSLLDLIENYPDVKVVNASWGSCTYNQDIQDMYQSIWQEKGVITVASAGNGASPTTCANTNEDYYYPASYDYVISVSSVAHINPRGFVHPQYGIFDWKDLHNTNPEIFPDTDYTHQHNDKVDIVAPGYAVITTNNANSYRGTSGTSFSSPMVAGAAALILSIRPDLTPDQVETILKNTADDIYWIPENQPYLGKLGAGRLNLYRALKTTECLDEQNPIVDFIVRDSFEDLGEEPNNITQYMWTSSDIFVRNQNDGINNDSHQNPTYDGINPNYIYVRVTNLGCQTSSGNDTVTVNWAKANTSLAYPDYWDGSITQNGVVFGGLVGTGTIPSLAPGQEALVEIPWNVPNPQDYQNINENPWHFCLLAEINSDDDPLTSPHTTNPNHMVRNNNNLAWKNITVIDVSDKKDIGAAVAVTNPSNSTKTYFLELVKEDTETGKAIYEEAEVAVKMDNVLYAAWERGGKTASQLENTKDEKKKIVKGNNVIVDNLQLNANELGTVYISFNFLTKETTDKNKYRYHVIQKDAATGEIMGGETFEIKKKPRNLFAANAGNDREIAKNEEVTLTAQDIFEAAQYNWYDENGNLIYTGKNITVSPEVTKKYKLEVITEDGFKDYSEVDVVVNPYELTSISPNPASSQIQVNYDIENSTSAYIMITGVTNGVSNNYVLNTNSTQTTISLNNYQSGHYVVTLVCDGQIIESKNLIKN